MTDLVKKYIYLSISRIFPFSTMAESEPLWKACADWLCRLEVLPENHRILLPDANIEDLGKF